MDENNQVIPNLPEKLSGYGYISGIVTTDNLDGATPAAFFAHQPERGMSKEIWADLPNSKLTFFSAGSYELFEKQAPNVQKEIKKEFTIIEEPNDKAIKKSKKLGYLPTKSKTASVNENRGDFLPSTTQMAIDYLSSRSTNGFFLMVEGARIDKSAHNNDYSAVVREVLDFDKAVEAAIRFAEKDGNTLVIISADHETGALALRDGNIKEGKMKAIVSITLDNEFVIHDIKVIEGEKGLFIAMPSRKAADGEYRDIAHPINSETRDMIQNVILHKYEMTTLEAAQEALEG